MSGHIIPVVLAGGNGSRLWPVSRESYPKQFCKFIGQRSLLQETVMRAQTLAPNAPCIIITNEQHYFLCKDQLDSIDATHIHYILEPCGKNTATAIAIAALYAQKNIDPHATLLVLPSDHYIHNKDILKDVVTHGLSFVTQGFLAVFGIAPTTPKTGYGYIERGETLDAHAFRVTRFAEKPNKQLAETYLSSGNFYWNSGMFLFQASTYLDELLTHAPDIYEQSNAAFEASSATQEFFRISKLFQACRSSSIDYEVMEKTDKAVVLPLATGWNDLGCWASIAELGESDEHGNICRGNVIANQSHNCFITSDDHRVVAIGMKDHIIISTADAVLVADKTYSQDIKHIVSQMKLDKDSTATEHRRVYRPWGFYERLAAGPGYQVKHLVVNPGASLSLQLHHHRSEHWVIVSGQANIVNGDTVLNLTENQSTYIEKETKHRLSNPGTEPLSIIEVQCGAYISEEDIVRFEDEYNRSA